MRLLSCWLIMGGMLVLLLASCESNDSIAITAADNGQTITVSVNDTLEVELWGNPSTGYTWNRVTLTTNVLVAKGNPEFQLDSDAAGAGGMYYFCYKAETAGVADLKLTYNRVFEPATSSDQVFQVTIVVQP